MSERGRESFEFGESERAEELAADDDGRERSWKRLNVSEIVCYGSLYCLERKSSSGPVQMAQ